MTGLQWVAKATLLTVRKAWRDQMRKQYNRAVMHALGSLEGRMLDDVVPSEGHPRISPMRACLLK
jgi:hypothetical protein